MSIAVNLDAERSVLGAAMTSAKALDAVTEVVSATDFYEPRHQTLFAAMRRLDDGDKPVDAVTVVDELMRTKLLLGNLTVEYVHELEGSVPVSSNAGYYARIVRDASLRRQVTVAAEKAAQIAVDASLDADAVAELARDQFDSVGASTTRREVEALGEWITAYLGTLTEKPSYTKSPWPDLNNLINGFRDTGMYVIAARPSVGKTIVAVQIARKIAEFRPVLFVSLEMAREEIAARLIAQAGQVFLGNLNRHEISDKEWQQIEVARNQLSALPLVIVGSDEVATIPQLKGKVRSVARMFKRNPVIVIDYLQLLSSEGPVESRQVEVAGFSRALKQAAQKWRVPVIALSQLNRASAGRKGQEPVLSDLRESGAIEQDADVVFLLHDKKVRGAPDDLIITVAKNRQGQTGSVTLQKQGQFARAVQKAGFSEQLFN